MVSCQIKTGDEVDLALFPDQVVAFENTPTADADDEEDLTCVDDSQHLVDDSSGSDSSDYSLSSSSSYWSSSDEDDSDSDDGGDGHQSMSGILSLDAILALQLQSKGGQNAKKKEQPNLKLSPTRNKPTLRNLRMNRKAAAQAAATTPIKRESLKRSDSMMTLLHQGRRTSKNITQINQAMSAQQSGTDDINVGTITPTNTSNQQRHSIQYKNQEVFVEKPQKHLEQILQDAGVDSTLLGHDELSEFFLPVTPQDTAAFDSALVNAVRTRDFKTLQELHQSRGPQSLQARSPFGESLLHVCARRGTPEILRYMLHEAHVTHRVCCDYGRTALHDAAWSNEAQALEMMKILIQTCPDLLLVKDKRGSTPLDYIPRDRWVHACAFLDKHKDMLVPTGCLVEK